MASVEHEQSTKFEARDSGHIVARVNVSLTFFMKDWRGREANLVAAYQRVRPLIEDEIRWYRTGTMRGMGKIRRGTLDAPIVLEQAPPPKGVPFILRLTSGRTADDVGPVTFYLSLSDSAVEKEASAFHIALPLELAKKPDTVKTLFLDLAALLPFRSGLAGYATQVDEGAMDPAADEACRGWLRRYVGIDSMHVVLVKEPGLSKVKGVNWLTALDKAFTTKVGGVGGLKKALTAGIVVHEVNGGVVLQAGRQPQLGDTYKDEKLSDYRAVDKAIRPVRLEGEVVLPGFQDAEETAEWMARLE